MLASRVVHSPLPSSQGPRLTQTVGLGELDGTSVFVSFTPESQARPLARASLGVLIKPSEYSNQPLEKGVPLRMLGFKHEPNGFLDASTKALIKREWQVDTIPLYLPPPTCVVELFLSPGWSNSLSVGAIMPFPALPSLRTPTTLLQFLHRVYTHCFTRDSYIQRVEAQAKRNGRALWRGSVSVRITLLKHRFDANLSRVNTIATGPNQVPSQRFQPLLANQRTHPNLLTAPQSKQTSKEMARTSPDLTLESIGGALTPPPGAEIKATHAPELLHPIDLHDMYLPTMPSGYYAPFSDLRKQVVA